MQISPIPPHSVPSMNDPQYAALRETAIAFEASFLSEMLKHTGLGEPRQSFGGGAGEEMFSSLIANEYADQFAARGGIGLAQHIFETLVERSIP